MMKVESTVAQENKKYSDKNTYALTGASKDGDEWIECFQESRIHND